MFLRCMALSWHHTREQRRYCTSSACLFCMPFFFACLFCMPLLHASFFLHASFACLFFCMPLFFACLFCMPLLHADDGHRERNALHTQRAVLDFAAVRGCCRVIANPTVTRQAVFKLACVSRSSKFHVCGLSERRARATQLQFTGR